MGFFVGRPVASVHIDIARFLIEVQDNDSTDSAEKLGLWTRQFARALALNNPDLNRYAGYLLCEVEEFRKAETERKRQYYDTERHGKTRKDNDSSLRQTVSKKERVNSSPIREKDPIWDVVVGVFKFSHPHPPEEAARIGKTVRFLKQKNALPQEITERFKEAEKRWKEPFGPEALTKHWDSLAPVKKPYNPLNP